MTRLELRRVFPATMILAMAVLSACVDAPTGTNVFAAADGRIERIRNQGEGVGYGLYMIVRHTDGSATLYAHLESTSVANSFALNNLIPGSHTLGVQATIAPDNAGTFEVILSDGITFSGGGVQTSGVLAQGATANFTIIVPSEPTPEIAPALLMQPNAYREGK